MIKTLSLLFRADVADQAQAVHDANALAVLRQQIRDAAGAVAVAKRELAVAMSYRSGEARAVEALAARGAAVEEAAARAFADGREDLAREAAIRIAALEDEAADRKESLAGFEAEVGRLRTLVANSDARLRDLDRGLQAARAAEAVRRAGANGRRVVISSGGALQEAEATLARLRERQAAGNDFEVAIAELAGAPPDDIEARLDGAGYGRRRTDPDAVFERLRARQAA